MGCEISVQPEKLMCVSHWFMVPAWIRSQVWSSYRAGQCDDRHPSGSWMIAATRAICAVAVREGVLTKDQANAKIAREIELFSAHARNPPTMLVNLRGTDHRGNHVYIGRGSPFGNPFSHNPDTKYRTIQVNSREEAIARYRVWINGDEEIEGWPKPTEDQILALRSKTLACYCVPLPCHGEVLIDYIEAFADVCGVSPSVAAPSDASSSSNTTEGTGSGTTAVDALKGIEEANGLGQASNAQDTEPGKGDPAG